MTNWIKKTFSHGNVVLMDQIGISGSNFITTILVARILGLSSFGEFTLAWSILLLFSTVSSSIVIVPMMSIGPKIYNSRNLNIYYGTATTIQLALSTVSTCVAIIGILVYGSYDDSWKNGFASLAVGLCFFSIPLQEFCRKYYITRGKIVLALIVDLANYVPRLAVLFLIAASSQEKTVNIFGIFGLIGLCALTSAPFLLIEQKFTWGLSKRAKYFIRRNWRFSKWILPAQYMQWVSGNFFVFGVAYLLGAHSAGAIAAARNVVGPTLIIFAALETIMPRKASMALLDGGLKSLKNYLVKSLISWGVGTLFICGMAALFADILMVRLYGLDYTQYSYLVYWFCITHMVMFFLRPLGIFLKTIEHTKPFARTSFLAFLFAVLFTIPLITFFGMIGAMATMLTTQLFLLIGLGYTVRYEWIRDEAFQ